MNIGPHGEINSLYIVADSFPTNYVLNGTNSPQQNTTDHQWLGELIFEYRVGSGDFIKASSNASADVRKIMKKGNAISVTYEKSSTPEGIRDFKVVSTYTLENNCLLWNIDIENTGSEPIEIADFGLPLTFNEKWPGGNEIIYETRVLCHSNVAQNSSWMRITRPSGIGKFLLMVTDTATGSGFEYRDVWDTLLHPGSAWTAPKPFDKGLFVYYLHANRIKSTSRGYLPTTSLFLQPGETKNYSFRFYVVANEQEMKSRIYKEGLVDVTVVPGMIVPTNLSAKLALHCQSKIHSIAAQFPQQTTITFERTGTENQQIYSVTFGKIGQNNIIVTYGNNLVTTLQFYVIEPMGDALRRHADFLVKKQMRHATGQIFDNVFDDWMMEKRTCRNLFDGYWGWGDDWGFVKALFLAQKNIYAPVAGEIAAVDRHMEEVIWKRLMKEHQHDYLIHDFLMPEPNTTPTYRGYAYPHIYNTYFALYQLSKLHSDIVAFINPASTYLIRAFNIFKALYNSSGVYYNWDTGLMGEQTTPEIIEALKREGFQEQADEIQAIMNKKYRTFSSTTYPFGSEYSYDNTGEEAVYTLAKMNNNVTIMSKINMKTRACRGNMPLWYYYAIPVTICGESRWNGQYTVSLAGYCMNDWMMYHSKTSPLDARLTYAAKIGNIAHINSGQISSDPDNIGAAAWTYHSSLGKDNQYWFRTDWGTLQNGWRQMDGEAQLGLWGAIRLLSADVATDPLFGLYGYGCDVSEDGNNYMVYPKDGMNRKLNIVDIGFTMELDQDQYSSATVGKKGTACIFSLENMKATEHTVNVSLRGLKDGIYYAYVNGERTGPFEVTSPSVHSFALHITSEKTSRIQIHTDTATIGTIHDKKGENAPGKITIRKCDTGCMISFSEVQRNPVSIRIINQAGRVVQEKYLSPAPVIFDSHAFQKLSYGVYIVTVRSGTRLLSTKILIL